MMSDPQQKVFDVIAQYIADHGYPPTVREVQATLGYGSTATVQVHIEALRAKGYLAGAGRTLRLGFRATD